MDRILDIQKTKESEEIVYNQCILIGLSAFPDSKEFIQWAIDLLLTVSPKSNEEGNYHLVRPLNLESIDQYNQTRQNFYIDQWRILQKYCNNLVILPPTFDSNYSSKPKQLNKSKIVFFVENKILKK